MLAWILWYQVIVLVCNVLSLFFVLIFNNVSLIEKNKKINKYKLKLKIKPWILLGFQRLVAAKNIVLKKFICLTDSPRIIDSCIDYKKDNNVLYFQWLKVSKITFLLFFFFLFSFRFLPYQIWVKWKYLEINYCHILFRVFFVKALSNAKTTITNYVETAKIYCVYS